MALSRGGISCLNRFCLLAWSHPCFGPAVPTPCQLLCRLRHRFPRRSQRFATSMVAVQRAISAANMRSNITVNAFTISQELFADTIQNLITAMGADINRSHITDVLRTVVRQSDFMAPGLGLAINLYV